MIVSANISDIISLIMMIFSPTGELLDQSILIVLTVKDFMFLSLFLGK